MEKGKKKIFKKKWKEKRGLFLRILPRRSSFDDKPFYEVSSCTVQTNKYLDRVAKAHKFSK